MLSLSMNWKILNTRTNDAPVWHEYDIANDVVAFSTMRQGGFSTGNYAAFNINHYCGDAEEAVAANRAALCRMLGISEDRLIYPHQTHQTEVRAITPDYFSMSADDKATQLEGVDAVMTDMQGVCIGVSTADCIPVLLYDEAHHAVAAVHAGWRGTVARIAEKAVRRMQYTYQTQPEKLQAVIGPGISMQNFEVGDEVYDAFLQAGFEMTSIAKRFPYTLFKGKEGCTESDGKTGRWHIDLPRCNQLQLEKTGVMTENILQSDICTYDRYLQFFSARRLGISSGRILTAIMLK